MDAGEAETGSEGRERTGPGAGAGAAPPAPASPQANAPEAGWSCVHTDEQARQRELHRLSERLAALEQSLARVRTTARRLGKEQPSGGAVRAQRTQARDARREIQHLAWELQLLWRRFRELRSAGECSGGRRLWNGRQRKDGS
jgi:hypothetical protein